MATTAEPSRVYTTWGEMIRHWPKTTFLIVSNEFCERFSYYGMRTVLLLYFLTILKFKDSTATIFFNIFDIFCYTTPILGSILADGYIGKFWTIFSVSILYASGQILLAISSTNNASSSVHPAMDMAGLLIIAFGTGGIKPCVSAFGADQFDPRQEKMISIYFSVFYFSINAGSMVSTFISPIFRSMPCLGQDSCYPLCFGIPACLMIVATAIFMSGSWWYKKNPPKENIFGQVLGVIGVGFARYVSGKEKKEHWLDHYMTKHHCERDSRCIALTAEKGKPVCHKKTLVEDVKGLLRVIIMLLPVPVFWSLYNQQPTTWLIQGIQMNCKVGSVLILPDQMQVLNAVLILVFIPIFQIIIYPLFSLCIKLTPLRKMVAGGLLASLAFVLSGFVQLSVNSTLPTIPHKGQAFISVWNQLYDYKQCTVNASIGEEFHSLGYNQTLTDNKSDKTSTFHVTFPGKAKKDSKWSVLVNLAYDNSSGPCPNNLPTSISVTVESTKIYFIGVNPNGLYYTEAKPDKPTEGTGEFSMGIVAAMNEEYSGNLAVCRVYQEGDKHYNDTYPCDPQRPSDFYWWENDYDNHHKNDTIDFPTFQGGNRSGQTVTVYDFKPVKPGRWHLYYILNKPKDTRYKTYNKTAVLTQDAHYEFEYHAQGGVYVLNMSGPKNKTNSTTAPENDLQIWQLVQSNKINILWQVPQIVVITAAEICFSITGYEFAYSQSAPSMKAMVQALWLFTIALGDMIIIAITAINPFPNAATQFFAFAGIMAAVIGIFCLLAIFFYDYREVDTNSEASESSSIGDENNLEPIPKKKENWEDEEDIHF